MPAGLDATNVLVVYTGGLAAVVSVPEAGVAAQVGITIAEPTKAKAIQRRKFDIKIP